MPPREDSHAHASLQETTEQNLVPSSRTDLGIYVKEKSLSRLEAVLRYFQCTCKPAVAGMPPLKWAALAANVACAAAEAFVMCKEPPKEGGCHDVGGGEVLR